MSVIQILDDADVVFRISDAELRTDLPATTMLQDKPHRLNGRTIAQRFRALGTKRTWRDVRYESVLHPIADINRKQNRGDVGDRFPISNVFGSRKTF